ncbi:suppressor of fused domain protein [Streptomyces olivochromogenes]|uniref:suppressor of fused domain protein n=1 Tax=Streptomyces olivochromogenes TaxID=1963 RepID=UPI0036BA2F13
MTLLNDPDRLTRFVERLGTMVGAEPDIQAVPPRELGDGEVFALVFADVPEPGFVTGFTYGLSPWQRAHGQPPARELCITMRSRDQAWARVPALTVAALRGLCPFSPGSVIGYMKPYVAGSGLSSLVLAGPAPALALPEAIDLADSDATPEDLVRIVGAYPIHASEREAIRFWGPATVWDSRWDPYDPARPAVV